jgi:Kdo2-lipid IVA lauroyltransferase/acyltransferase
VTATLLHTLIHAVGRLPLRLGRLAGLGIGALIWLLPNRVRRTTRVNLDRCFPELPAAARRRLARASLMHLGQTLTDSAWAWTRSPAVLTEAVRETRGMDLVHAARDRGDGIIFVSPHIGCWELVGIYLAEHVPLTALYRPPRLAALEAVMTEGRQRSGATLVPTDGRGIRALHKALKRGETIGILPDQAPHPGHGVIAPFFGNPARTMTLLSRMARATNVTVIFCVMERLPHGAGFCLHLLPGSRGIGQPDDVAAATVVNQDVERCIALCPEQYMWSYRRFRRTGGRA